MTNVPAMVSAYAIPDIYSSSSDDVSSSSDDVSSSSDDVSS